MCPGSSENDRAFAQWVLDWGWKDGSGGSIFDQCRRKRGKDRSVGAPSFRGGRVVQSVQGDGMVLWFVQIFGGTRGKVEGFEKAVGMIRGV